MRALRALLGITALLLRALVSLLVADTLLLREPPLLLRAGLALLFDACLFDAGLLAFALLALLALLLDACLLAFLLLTSLLGLAGVSLVRRADPPLMRLAVRTPTPGLRPRACLLETIMPHPAA